MLWPWFQHISTRSQLKDITKTKRYSIEKWWWWSSLCGQQWAGIHRGCPQQPVQRHCQPCQGFDGWNGKGRWCLTDVIKSPVSPYLLHLLDHALVAMHDDSHACTYWTKLSHPPNHILTSIARNSKLIRLAIACATISSSQLWSPKRGFQKPSFDLNQEKTKKRNRHTITKQTKEARKEKQKRIETTMKNEKNKEEEKNTEQQKTRQSRQEEKDKQKTKTQRSWKTEEKQHPRIIHEVCHGKAAPWL